MTKAEIKAAIEEAHRFIWRGEQAIAKMNREQMASGFTHEVAVTSKETAACRRSSMDLTRALANLRKS